MPRGKDEYRFGTSVLSPSLTGRFGGGVLLDDDVTF